jgi:NAD(P)-dependent dehydrogenase (short-subunit alcohol dehydrogenase family)
MRLISAVSRVRVPSPLTVDRKCVLVTGASSGIGRECATLLAARGFKVFAGVRRQEDAVALASAAPADIRPLMLDVTDPVSIEAAAAMIRASLDPSDWFSLVNNAGITVAGPLELLEMGALRRQLEVNVLGPVAVTQALLPTLREHRGRIILMGSLFGRIALPFVAPYAAAKFALEAIADSLSLELQPWGISVSLLEPGNIATPIWQRTKERAMASVGALPADKLGLYREALHSFEKLTDWYAKSGIPASRVARIVARALTARRPRIRYRVGMDARFYGTFGPLLPDRFRHWVLRLAVLRK